MSTDPFLSLTGIRKTFGEKVALDRVDLAVARGEVHVVCGENGAGKSTLMNILAGILRPDAGAIAIAGRTVRFASPLAAAEAGIGMVHQHFALVPSMSVAENIYLGRQPVVAGLFSDRRAMNARAAELIGRYRFDLDPAVPVGRLSVGQRQRVEILKALAFDAEILILDEPTAVLTPAEVEELLGVIAGLRQRGRTVLFITHKLNEVKAVSDRVTVLRLGRTVATHVTAEVEEADIAREMVGRAVFLTGRGEAAGEARPLGPVALAVEGAVMTTAAGRRLLDGVSLEVRAGEVLGIAGVDGNGQTELGEAVVGLRPLQAGRVAIAGADMTAASPRHRRDAGLGFVPEDRLDRGVSATMSIAENLAADSYRAAGLKRFGLIAAGRISGFARKRIAAFDIRGAEPGLAVGFLSGGNMQKVVLAREFERAPRILVAAQPTRGLDVGAAEFVHRQILAAADRGCAVLLISSELSEIFALSDRIAVMHRGRVMDTLARREATEERVGLLMGGARGEAA